jgi:Family of unknown function (DUF6152)
MNIHLARDSSLVFLALGWLAMLPASAHHSYAAYEQRRTVTLTGTITSFEWKNPHVVIVLSAPSHGGHEETWSIGTSSPGILARFGWTHSSVKMGDSVTVLLNPQSDGSHFGRLHTLIVLGSGKRLETKLSALDAPADQ